MNIEPPGFKEFQAVLSCRISCTELEKLVLSFHVPSYYAPNEDEFSAAATVLQGEKVHLLEPNGVG